MVSAEQKKVLVARAVNLSFACNLFLFIAKLTVLIMNFSMVMLASTIDSVLDLLSGSILFITHKVMEKQNPKHYPGGLSRFEPIGILVFAIVMGTSSLQIIVMSCLNLYNSISGETPVPDSSWLSVGTLLGVITVKMSLFFYCRSIRSAFVDAYTDDHFNDCLSNGFAVVILVLLSFFPEVWYLDDSGAILISAYILSNWIETGMEQSRMLAAHKPEDEVMEEVQGRLADGLVRMLREAQTNPRLAGMMAGIVNQAAKRAAASSGGNAPPSLIGSASDVLSQSQAITSSFDKTSVLVDDAEFAEFEAILAEEKRKAALGLEDDEDEEIDSSAPSKDTPSGSSPSPKIESLTPGAASPSPSLEEAGEETKGEDAHPLVASLRAKARRAIPVRELDVFHVGLNVVVECTLQLPGEDVNVLQAARMKDVVRKEVEAMENVERCFIRIVDEHGAQRAVLRASSLA